MTATMTKPVQTTIEIAEPKLKFRITNQKTKYFPDKLEKTDYHELSVGDIVIVGTNYNTLYEVIEIQRCNMHETDYNYWKSRAAGSVASAFGKSKHPKDQRLLDLLEKYKNSSNFGVCTIRIKTLLRGNQVARRTSYKLFYEPYTVPCVNYKDNLLKVSLDELLNRKEAMAKEAEDAADRAIRKRDQINASKNGLLYLKNLREPKPVLDLSIQLACVHTSDGYVQNFDTKLLL